MMSIEFKGNRNPPRRTRRARRREKDWLSGFIHAGSAVIPEIPPFRSAHTTAKRCRESQFIKAYYRHFKYLYREKSIWQRKEKDFHHKGHKGFHKAHKGSNFHCVPCG